jgi:predicted NAD/FAD-binding protein
VRALTAPFRDRLRLETPVEFVRRLPDGAVVKAVHHAPQSFDAVVLACHSDQALALLRDPSTPEREILGAIPYQPNEAVLHTDTALIPRRGMAQASWNYMRFAQGQGEGGAESCTVTYDLTRLQHLPTSRRYLVTLNATQRIDPAKVVRRMTYEHPVYTAAGMAAQMRWPEINGRNRTYFCGAWWGYGFHEDGVRSGAAVAAAINGQAFDEELHLRRVG